MSDRRASDGGNEIKCASCWIFVTTSPALPLSLTEVQKCSLASHLMKLTWTAGNCQVRATLSSRSGGLFRTWKEATSTPWGHIKDTGCLFLCFLLYSDMPWRAALTHSNVSGSSDTLETIYMHWDLSHRGWTESNHESVWTVWAKMNLT